MRRFLAFVFAMLSAGCAGLLPARTPGSALERLPVLLALGGDPLTARDTRRVTSALEERLQRPVVVAREAAADRTTLATRLATRYGRPPADGWGRERCAIGEAAAHALAYDTNAHYRLVLRRRPDRLDGELVATTFGVRPATTRVAIHATDRDAAVARAVGAAAATLDPPPYPLWDGLARHLLERGCALAALAIHDARLRDRPGSRDNVGLAVARPTPSTRAPDVPTATPTADVAPVTPTIPRPSCRALCELHMVEVCNNDRELWNQHRAAWTTTPCGQRRDEAFLRECYERQWVTGTLQDACITPCRRADEGRARLLHLLQREGCSRLPSS